MKATSWVDVSIRALVQEKMLPLKQIMQYAVQEKRGMFPLKDSQGHRVVSGDFVPFVMTNMGSLDKAAHQFLRKLRKKSRQRTDHLMDVLVVQHAKWIARRLQRCVISTNQRANVRLGPESSFRPPSSRPGVAFRRFMMVFANPRPVVRLRSVSPSVSVLQE